MPCGNLRLLWRTTSTHCPRDCIPVPEIGEDFIPTSLYPGRYKSAFFGEHRRAPKIDISSEKCRQTIERTSEKTFFLTSKYCCIIGVSFSAMGCFY
jgi:hypothetical protein